MYIRLKCDIPLEESKESAEESEESAEESEDFYDWCYYGNEFEDYKGTFNFESESEESVDESEESENSAKESEDEESGVSGNESSDNEESRVSEDSESPESSEKILDEADEFCARKNSESLRKTSESSDPDDFLKPKYYSDINHFGKE